HTLLIYRHLSYINALRLTLRGQHDKYQSELKELLSTEELNDILAKANKPTQINNNQAKHIRNILKDEMKVLSNAQDGKTKAMRHWKFRKQEKIDIDLVKTYVLESIDNHKNGKEVIVKIDTTYETPPLLLDALNNNDSLNSSFYGLTPGRQKEYANYITEAKQDTTKQKRLIKITPMILEGKGLHDKYRKC
ncbi:MAG: YdeI/OmpD-associated family protein, partial [Bacteroidia bacterium]